MTDVNNSAQAAALTEALLARKLRPARDYPAAFVQKVRQTYTQFLKAYLDLIQLQGSAAPALQADTFRVDETVVDEMRHFFSDYQHITREYIRVARLLASLGRIDRQKQPHLFQQVLDEVQTPGRESDLLKGVMQ